MANEVELILGAATDVGRERQVNEDSHGFVHCAAGDLLMVCDGMGGHAAGDLASRTARDAIAAYVATYAASVGPRELLEKAILHGHEAVRNVAALSQANAGMGTTCVLALVQGKQAWIANVGDSRCYLVRGAQLQQLSVDHTKARKLLEAGIISAEQFANHPEKGVLAQALGQRAVPQPFVSDSVPLVLDDYFVLCSDGVYDSTERDMISLTSANNPNYGAHNLVIEAVKRDGKDNATVVIGRYVNMNRTVAGAAAAPVVAAAEAPVKTVVPWKHPQLLGVLAGVLLLGMAAGWALGGKCGPAETGKGAEVKVEEHGASAPEVVVPVAAPVDESVPAKDSEIKENAPQQQKAQTGAGQPIVVKAAEGKKDKDKDKDKMDGDVAKPATPAPRAGGGASGRSNAVETPSAATTTTRTK